MKDTIIESLKQLIKDRYLLFLVIFFIIASVISTIIVGLSVYSSERQVVSHYSVFGVEHFYYDQWFYLLSFVLFCLMVLIIHTIITVKLLVVKSRHLALAFCWLSIGLVLAGLNTALTVISFGKHF